MSKLNISRRGMLRGVAVAGGLAAAEMSIDVIGKARAEPARRTFVLVHSALPSIATE
jgi:hypothetical protein